MIGIFGFFALSMFAIAGAFDGEMAIPATPLLIRSSTIWTSPASSALDAGPVYRQVYSEFGFSLFHKAQPLPSTVKNGLSKPFTTTARVFFCAMAGPLKASTSDPTAASANNVLFICPLLSSSCDGHALICCSGQGASSRMPLVNGWSMVRPQPKVRRQCASLHYTAPVVLTYS